MKPQTIEVIDCRPKVVLPPAQFPVRREAWIEEKIGELTTRQRRIAGTAEAALVEVQKAQILASQASNFLTVRGTGCARIRLLQARERINAALVILEDEK